MERQENLGLFWQEEFESRTVLCPSCGKEISEDFFNEAAPTQHCPFCHLDLPRNLAIKMQEEFESRTVLCPSCGHRAWNAEVDVDCFGFYVCPECGGAYPTDFQEKLESHANDT